MLVNFYLLIFLPLLSQTQPSSTVLTHMTNSSISAAATKELPSAIHGVSFDEWVAATARIPLLYETPDGIHLMLGVKRTEWDELDLSFEKALLNSDAESETFKRFMEIYTKPLAGRLTQKIGDYKPSKELGTFDDYARVSARLAAAKMAGKDEELVFDELNIPEDQYFDEEAKWHRLMVRSGRDDKFWPLHRTWEAYLAQYKKEYGVEPSATDLESPASDPITSPIKDEIPPAIHGITFDVWAAALALRPLYYLVPEEIFEIYNVTEVQWQEVDQSFEKALFESKTNSATYNRFFNVYSNPCIVNLPVAYCTDYPSRKIIRFEEYARINAHQTVAAMAGKTQGEQLRILEIPHDQYLDEQTKWEKLMDRADNDEKFLELHDIWQGYYDSYLKEYGIVEK